MKYYDDFISALLSRNSNDVLYYIKSGFNVYEEIPKFSTHILNVLVSKDELDALKLLIDLGVDLNRVDNNRLSPLFFATTTTKNKDMIDFLLLNGAEYFNPHMQASLLDYLIITKNYEMADYLIHKAIEEYDDKLSCDDFSLISDVFHADLTETIEYYINYLTREKNKIDNELLVPIFYDFDDKHFYDKIPYIEACKYGSVNDVKNFLDNGIDINFQDNYGYSGLMWAIEKNNIDVAEYLINANIDVNLCSKSKYNASALLIASSSLNADNDKLVSLLIKSGADVNFVNASNDTCLQQAVNCGKLNTVKILIKNKANVNILSGEKNSNLLHFLNFNYDNYYEIAEFLLKNKLNIGKKNADGFDPILHMASFNHLDIVELLIKNGANVNSVDKTGSSPLIIASYNDNAEIVEYLLNNKAYIDTTDEDGWTALMAACENGSYCSARILINYGANTKLKNTNNDTAYDIAFRNNFKEIINLFKRKEF